LFRNNILKYVSGSALAVLTMAFWAGSTHAAMASGETAASTLGDLICNASLNGNSMAIAFQFIAYGAGVVAGLQGLHHLRLHSEDQRNNPLRHGLMLLFGSMCLLAFPTFVGTIVNALYTPTGSGSLTCTGVSSGGGGAGLEAMLTGFVTNIKMPLQTAASAVAIISGLFMMLRGLLKASKYGIDPKANSMHSILTNIGFGALLFTIGDNLTHMLGSVFGSTSIASTALNWNLPSGVSPEFTTAVSSALIFVQLIGTIAFVRGWLILKKVVEGGGNVTLAQGLTHIIGGVLAINIGQFLTLMDSTFGTGLLN
jgi:hypothetical protein